MKTTLSLCLIARNEADNIGRCLRSVQGVVDEIIVVDTGSADNTVEIARAAGAKVIEVKWGNDFSAARNASLENATGNWILFLDADEELAPESGPELRKVIQDGAYEAYFVLVTNPVQTGIALTFPSIRLFRNRKCFRFVGKIHEQIVPSIINHCGGEKIGLSNISIIHHGYNAATTNIQAKIRRNLKILEGYPKEARDGFFYYNLGTEHLRLGERKEALANYLKALKLTNPTKAYGPALVKRTMTTLMELRRYRDAIEQLRYYQTIYRDFNDLVLLEAACHLDCGRYSAAGARLQDYLEMPPAPAWYPTENIFQGASAKDLMDHVKTLALGDDHPAISVCIIGRDEADRAGHCIRSINEIASEVIFVDTGSTDRTPAIAYQLGANLYSFPWNHNFSDARNFAISKARGEWILVLDADEALPDESRKKITDLVREGAYEGYLLKICTYLDRSLSPANCQLQGACRLFRNKNYRYRGAVMEDVACSIRESGDRIGCADITINHLHYLAADEEVARKRGLKTAAIEQGMAADPARQSFALGVEAFYARDFASAVKYFGNVSESLEEAERSGFYYFYALAALNTGNYRRAVEISDRALTLFPDYTDLVYTQAVARFMLGETGRAELLLNCCLEMGDAPWEKYLTSPGTGSFKARCSLGTIYAHKGETGRALKTFVEAAGIPGAFEQAVESIVFLQGQLPTALERFLEEHGMLNSRSLGVASTSLAKMGRYKESLKYLALAGDRIAQEPAPQDFARITQAIDFLIKRFHWQALQKLPEDAHLRNCLTI